ncbi:hypothetical protein VC83_00325 [Pseudogymnoascus destructans]|uniref:Mso1 N-terminal domain-containing protein n=2 Tax=Pseudogymnoascus destructans TaxID=655981 RepID=L8G6M1_PSED2|nr:uncharacterized protein VC83_00325 [Pseudogymnoascus destructans]ELR08757.1 hypothetical protein GMDG_03436 [Pseudogymnoascus destructans 20631-21]OAF63435.1 hypothetical protein VC83_00325 [Pseudogymnoascus destructans]
MSSYLSNLLTTTSTRYASLRNLLPAGEADGDTPDDTHICRVLRAYYIEKGGAFPPWLPPDPKAAPPPQVQQQNYGAPVGAGYGNLANAGSSGNKLTSLWDNKASSGSPAPLPVNQSLRQGRPGGSPALRAGGGMQRGQQQQEYVAARPLPSQRDGSYQNSPALQPTTSAGSAQDRLKQRLWGGAKSNSSSQSSLDQVQGQPQGRSPGMSPGGSPQPPQPQRGGYERQESYNSGRSNESPGMSANSPWSQDGNGAGQYGRQGQYPRRQGLSSNPRGYR